MAPDVRGASLVALAEGVAAKKWKSRDLVEAYLDRIARLDKKIGAFLLLDADGARLLRQTVERFDYQKLIDHVQEGQGHV